MWGSWPCSSGWPGRGDGGRVGVPATEAYERRSAGVVMAVG